MTDGVRLAVWSGPRNISTALMRSWENRPDSRVVDEPLYAYYLAETGLNHPGARGGDRGRRDVLADGGRGSDRSGRRNLLPEAHDPPSDPAAAARLDRLLTNVLLIRDPAEVVASYVRSRADVVAEDIGLVQQSELYEQLGGTPPVIDAADFLRDPEGYLRWLCRHIGVDFTEAMLRWPAGPRASDGVWAPYWYDAVIASTGFEPYRPRHVELHGAALAAAQRSRPDYERLHAVRVVL